jgi:hypothetical protein
MRDEARHVAFGVLSLEGLYLEMPASELADREDFVIEACLLMRDRLVGEEIAEAVGFDPSEVREIILESPIMQMFRQALFARVVPNIKRLGLLTPRVRGPSRRCDPVRGRRRHRALGLVRTPSPRNLQAPRARLSAALVRANALLDASTGQGASGPRARRCCRAAGA